jgi:hypothetical protein
MEWNDGVGEIDLDAIWRVAVKESSCGRPGLRIGLWEHEMSTTAGRSTPIHQRELVTKRKSLLVFFCLLLHVADFLRDGLESVFVIGILHLQL